MRSAIVCVLLAACSSQPTQSDDTPVDCSTVTNADTFVVGLPKDGAAGAFYFQLMSAMPSPPARGDNTWVLQVNAMSNGVPGNPVSGASLTVVPFMPAHQHGAGIDVQVTAMTDPGTYKLEPVNLWMPGVWDTTITVNGTPSDQAVYRFCIPE